MDDIFKQFPELQEMLEKTAQSEILGKIPELLNTLLERIQEYDNKNEAPERKEARERLITQLSQTIGQMGRLSKKEGERLTEEQVKEVLEDIPRPMPKSIPWAFVPPKK